MLNIIRERRPIKFRDYTIEYRYKDDPNAGFTFPATCHGDPDFSCMDRETRANYEACPTDKRLTEGELEEDYVYGYPEDWDYEVKYDILFLTYLGITAVIKEIKK